MIQLDVDQKTIDSLTAKLQTFATRGANRASAKAIRQGLKVFERAQKAAAPVGTTGRKRKGVPIVPGGLRRSIGSRFLRSGKGRQRGVMSAKAGLNVGRKPTPKGQEAKGRSRLYAPHGHLYTLGTADRWAGVQYERVKGGARSARYTGRGDTLTGKRVAFRGAMPARPFIAQASQAVAPQAVAALTNTLAAELEKEAAKT